MFDVVRNCGRAVVAALALLVGPLAPDPALALEAQPTPMAVEQNIAAWDLKDVNPAAIVPAVPTPPAPPAPPAAPARRGSRHHPPTR